MPDGRPWLAIELVTGEPLNHRIGHGRLSIDDACALALDTLALSAADDVAVAAVAVVGAQCRAVSD